MLSEPPGRGLRSAALSGKDKKVRSLLAAAGAQATEQANEMGGALGYDGGTAATPLMLAAMTGHTKVVEALLELAELKVNRQQEFGESALIMAAMEGNAGVVQRLVADLRVDVNLYCAGDMFSASGEGESVRATALMMAAQWGHLGCVEALLGVPGVTVTFEDRIISPLHCAALGDHAGVIRALLNHGVDVNHRQREADGDGPTALFLAAASGNLAAVNELLKEPGVDLDVTRKDSWIRADLKVESPMKGDDAPGMTALQIARFEGYKDVVAVLEAAARAAVVKPSAAHITSNEPSRKKPKRG